jgi:hypothetical protein
MEVKFMADIGIRIGLEGEKDFKNAITESMFKGTLRNVLSESDGGDASKNTSGA